MLLASTNMPSWLTEFIAICSAFTVVCVAVGWLIKIIVAVRKPETNQNERISKLEAEVDTVKGFLANDYDRINAIECGNRVTQEAILALLDHAIDGNNIESLKRAKDSLHTYLLDRGMNGERAQK